jgi:hypothetical protein
MSRPAPDAGWIPFLKILFGVILLVSICALATIIALGKVQQETSFGLQDILGGLLVLCGGFSQWCFTSNSKPDEKPKD